MGVGGFGVGEGVEGVGIEKGEEHAGGDGAAVKGSGVFESPGEGTLNSMEVILPHSWDTLHPHQMTLKYLQEALSTSQRLGQNFRQTCSKL